MKTILFAGVSLVALLGVSTARAADLPARVPTTPAVAAPIPFTWTGFYLGGHTGVAVAKSKTSNTSPFGGFDAGVPLGYDVNPVSVFGGAQLGYNWQVGRWMLGFEGDIGYLGARDTIYPAPASFVEAKYGWYGTITGRVGIAYDRLLTYVKGGAAVAEITNAAGALVGPGTVDPFDVTDTKKTRWGWTVGTGFEFALSPVWSVKAEYLYMDFGKHSSTNLAGDVFEHKNHVHTAKIGLNYRWGGYQPPIAALY
jgi:outer membrane immunogenic protein